MDIRSQLIKEFDPNEIKWRIMEAGNKNGRIWAKACKYVDARLVQNRLDDVFGWNNWENDTKPVNYIDNKGKEKSGFICKLTVEYEGKKITKTDVADLTDYESFKGGASDAFKRTASSGYGIGRYLYESKAEFVDCSNKKDSYYTEYAKLKDGTIYYWAIPGSKKQDDKTDNKKNDDWLNTSSIDNKGNKTIITNEKPLIEDKHIKCIYAKTREYLLTDDDIKAFMKKNFKKDHKKDLNIEQFKAIMNYLDTFISVEDHKKIMMLFEQKGKDLKELDWFVEKWGLKDVSYMTKKHVNYLIDKLMKLPNKMDHTPQPVDEDVKALFATN